MADPPAHPFERGVGENAEDLDLAAVTARFSEG